MKKIFFAVAVIFFTVPGVFAQTKAGKVDTVQHASYYSCPMHPDMVSDKPGSCPKCGMALALSGKERMKAKEVKNYTCPIHVDVVSHNPGKCPKCGKKLNLSPKEDMKVQAAKIYTCPMHPDVALTKEGVCPKCGKDLVEKKPAE